MIDWLRSDVQSPQIQIAGKTLPIAIRRHRGARRLTMRLAPDGSELRVTMPQWGRTRDALTFAEARREWIARQLAQVIPPMRIAPDAAIPYRGHTVHIDWDAKAARTPRLEGARLVLGGPADRIETRVRRWLESEALRVAADDLAFFCTRAHRPAPALKLSRAKRRWGSCAAAPSSDAAAPQHCIRINWRLIMAPDEVRRSVVAHEVAHLAHFDHSPAFHALLSEVFDGDLAAADAWLKREGRSLYAICP